MLYNYNHKANNISIYSQLQKIKTHLRLLRLILNIPVYLKLKATD